VSCYKKHNSGDEDDDGSGNACTETFYHDRVSSVLQLERKAKEHDTLALLNRSHLLWNHQNIEEIQDDDDDNNYLSEEQREQLLQLMEILESVEAENDTEQQKQLSRLLAKFPQLKAAFETAIERGEVQPLILKPWSPWWRPVLVSADGHHDEVDADSAQKEEEQWSSHTLDERLLQVPSLDSLLPASKGKNKFPNLAYNLLEILYRIAWVLRIYHGVSNAIADEETAIDAAITLVQSSTVLKQDARYESLEEVFLSVVNGATHRANETTLCVANDGKGTGGTTLSWTLVAQDVAFLVENQNRRLIGRALLESLDILKAAISGLKKRKAKMKEQRQDQQEAERSSIKEVDLVKDLKRKRKKLEFFLSWSQHPNAKQQLPTSLSHDIRAWVEHWKHPANPLGDNELDGTGLELATLLIPTATQQQQERKQHSSPTHAKKLEVEPPLMEVQSTWRRVAPENQGMMIQEIDSQPSRKEEEESPSLMRAQKQHSTSTQNNVMIQELD
jgi:hypothetical protein